MTSPVPDALRTRLARAFRQGRDDAGEELGSFGAADAVLPLVTDLLVRARVEGAAEALQAAALLAEQPGEERAEDLRSQVAALLAASEPPCYEEDDYAAGRVHALGEVLDLLVDPDGTGETRPAPPSWAGLAAAADLGMSLGIRPEQTGGAK